VNTLRAAGLGKEYGGTTVLDGADLELRSGHLTGLVGENGAGKSTFIKILAGLIRPDRGTISVDDETFPGWSHDQARSHGLSVIHQELLLVPDLTVAQNIMLGEPVLRGGPLGRALGLRNDAENERRAAAILQELGVDSLDVRSRVRGISPSEAQMVLIARALRREARFLILDEPTAALAAEERSDLFALLRRLLERGAGLLLVSHHLHEVEELAHEVTVLRNGRVVDQLERPQITVPRMIESMLDRALGEQFPPLEHEPEDDVVLQGQVPYTTDGKVMDLTLRRGEILGITGLLGAGKTEFARALLGLDGVSASVAVDGRGERSMTGPRTAIRNGIALVPEERKEQALFPDLSVYGNSVVSVAATGRPRLGKGALFPSGSTLRGIQTRVVSEVGVRHASPKQQAALLSGGNQQKLVIARALAGSPRVLVLDEPTRGVDVGSRRDIYRIILEQASAGLAVILISSDVREAMSLAHRLLIFQRGRPAQSVDRPHEKSHDELAALLSTKERNDLDIDHVFLG
jgi:ABC-type sugar transport system ATPase subunit